MKKKITLSTISKESQVSIPTVSSILKGDPDNNSRYSKATYDKVTKVANDLGYRPNRTAKSLKNNNHGVIGILVKEFWYVHEPRFRGILQEASKNKQLVIMEAIKEGVVPEMVKEDCVDGIILFENIGDEIESEIARLRIPAVHVNSESNIIRKSIRFDANSAAKIGIDHFREKDKKHLALITGNKGAYQLECEEDFANYAKSYNFEDISILKFDKYYDYPSFESSVVDSIESFLSKNKKIDAVFLTNDYFAPSFYEACHRLNLSIPTDIAVIGCNNTTAAKHVIPSLTSISIDRDIIGNSAVIILNKVIKSKFSNKRVEEVFKYKLIERNSI